jgi:hypothetical protein
MKEQREFEETVNLLSSLSIFIYLFLFNQFDRKKEWKT